MKKALPVVVVLIIMLIGLAAVGMMARSGFEARDAKITALEMDGLGLTERLGELEKRNVALAAELSALRAQKAVVRLPDNFDELVDQKINEAFKESTDMSEALDTIIERKTDGIYDVVASLMNEQVEAIKDDERVEREEAQTQRRERFEEYQRQREQAELDALVEQLSLDETQKEEVAGITAAMRQRTTEAFATMREEGRMNIPEVMQSLRDENNEAMAEVLGEEQMTTYLEKQEREVGWLFNMMNRRGGSRGGGETQE